MCKTPVIFHIFDFFFQYPLFHVDICDTLRHWKTVTNYCSKPKPEVCDPCPSGWYRILDSCIWLSRDKKDFDSAQKQCAQLVDNGRLFEPKNSLQNDLVSTLIKSLQPSSALIGLTDRQSEGRFAYLSSGKEPSFSNWAPGEPNDWGSGEDCAHFFFKLMNGNNVHDSQWGKWNDVPCNMKWHYVCEKPLTT